MSTKQKPITGFTCGTFDLCHAGHFLVFKECKTLCDYLIVGLQSDPSVDRPDKNRPIMSLEERYEILSGIKYIDEIVVYNDEKDLYAYLSENQNRIDIRVIGADWKGKPFTGFDLPIKVHFNARGHKYSSTELRSRVFHAERRKKGTLRTIFTKSPTPQSR